MTFLPALLAAVLGQADAESADPAEPPQRTTTVIVYGNDRCPVSSDEEIVVCHRRPDDERYRVPKELREADRPLSERAWGARSGTLEDAARDNLPGSCSAVGTGGQTGCNRDLVSEWYEERRSRQSRRR